MSAPWIEDTVDLVGHHRILHQATWFESLLKGHGWECRCNVTGENLSDSATARREARRHTDTAILAALADAGLLLQPGGETQKEEQYGVANERAEDGIRGCGCTANSFAGHTHVRTVTTHTVPGPWLPVEGGAS